VALGSGIMQIPARQPAATAMAAATLDAISGGRFRLGLGVSGPQVSEGWYGVRFAKPLARTREYVEIVRAALAREAPLTFAGEHFELPLAGGLGKPLKLLARPARVPVYLGAVGPKSIEQVGAIADGWLPFMLHPGQPEILMEPLRRGLERAGRARSEIDVAATVPMAVADDPEAARDAARPWLAFYLGAMGAREKNFYVELADRYGHGDSARECQERFLAGDREGAMASLTPELLEIGTLSCTEEELPERLAAYEAAGVDTLVAVPLGDKERVVRALAAAR
jgi:F420-dependent oxidoreductase-like protein